MNSDPAQKPWWQSKTILGIGALLGVVLFQRFGLEVNQDDLSEIITPLVALIAAVIAVVGRVKARKDLTLTKPGGAFNPNAEVRKAKPVRSRRGHIERLMIIFLAFICFVGFCAAGGFSVQRYEASMDLPGTVRYDVWLRSTAIEDRRPFLTRLVDSLRFSLVPKVAHDAETGRIRTTIASIQLKGGAQF